MSILIKKEVREAISSSRTLIAFSVCSLLILLSFYVGGRSYQMDQTRYDAAVSENNRQLESLTEWHQLRYKIFLPPQPLASLVNGVSNDMGRQVSLHGSKDLNPQDSRFSDDPIFAVFRFLDLTFIFQIILSLFAIVFSYNAINGEKEQGTLKLTFSNSIPKDHYIIGKIIGSITALLAPLSIPFVGGFIILLAMNIPLSGDDWFRLLLIIFTGYVFLSVFIVLSVLISALTDKSSTSFLVMLVIWIFMVLVIPRTAVLLAGRAVEVPSVDELNSKKATFRSQAWNEDREKMGQFKPSESDPTRMMEEFNKFMTKLREEREGKIDVFTDNLNVERSNRQQIQHQVGFGISRISPASVFSLAVMELAGSSLSLKNDFIQQGREYQTQLNNYIKSKNNNSGMMGGMIMIRSMDDQKENKVIDTSEMPVFIFRQSEISNVISNSLIDISLLSIFNLVCFGLLIFVFLKYDVR